MSLEISMQMWADSDDCPCDICGRVPCHTFRKGKVLCDRCAAKPLLTSIFRENPDTPEGKYLIKRRSGDVVTAPSFVLLAPDPRAADTLRHYALLCERDGLNAGFVASLRRWADTFDKYRAEHGDSDPDRGKHRVDDPATIEEMKKGMSA